MASSSPSEHEIQQRIRLACGRGPVRLWRNNTGALVDQQGRFVRFGKTAQGVLSPEQRAFPRLVQQLGGVAAACRSVEEAEQLLAAPRQVRWGCTQGRAPCSQGSLNVRQNSVSDWALASPAAPKGP